ncbi:MAG: ABC transporter ATP-binding protein [Pseudobutyrivibrio ruminis]|uniref:ABC transporter ATP-binding protein n=1 Tax=Pseudobutyrivibrio ruminis TaxID=46206 RepID=UPI0026EFE11A|nr:ABC transporter ATP-binding protein [Pseudobutyrivibrio ruminis]MBE5914013.1 ABC transporter ATP-binding protein [Pseudobutyrivibrio ruminis]
MEKIVELKGVNKIYGSNHVVKDLDLFVEEGEFLTLLGSSGCGKTTTLRMIAGFEEPTTGSIQVEGENVEEKEPFERNVNTVFQSYALFPHMTIYENIAYGLKIKKVSKAEIKERVFEMMDLVQLSGFEKRYPSQLSGGQKQRVAIARALINKPKVLLLDEPLGALDLKLRKQMQLELKRLQKKLNITFIYVTHDQEEALTMSDRIAVMHDGVIDQLATPTEIYEKPKTKFVATFIGETNIYDGCITSISDGIAKITLENGVVLVKCPEDFSILEYASVSVRPEKMKFSSKEVEGFGLVAQVKDYVYVGSVLKCIVSLPNGNELKIERLAGQDIPEIGSRCYPYWNPEDAVLIHNKSHFIFEALNNIKLA